VDEEKGGGGLSEKYDDLGSLLICIMNCLGSWFTVHPRGWAGCITIKVDSEHIESDGELIKYATAFDHTSDTLCAGVVCNDVGRAELSIELSRYNYLPDEHGTTESVW